MNRIFIIRGLIFLTAAVLLMFRGRKIIKWKCALRKFLNKKLHIPLKYKFSHDEEKTILTTLRRFGYFCLFIAVLLFWAAF